MIGLLLVAQLAIVARGPESATSCAPFELTVAVRAPGPSAARIEAPGGDALQVLRARLTTRTEIGPDGRPTTFTEGTYLVASHATGRLAIPPFVAVAGGITTRAAPLVVDLQAQETTTPTVLVRSTLDTGSGTAPDTLFVGQQVDYVVDVQLNESARQRLRHNPTFFPPEMPAVLAYDLAPPAPVVREGPHCFETLSYRRALFPLFPGETRIAPATLTYSLPLSTSFFSREETFELRTDSVRFVAIEPPAQGRPADFAGAVGALQASARLGEPSGRMGDPVVLTLRLSGTGNVKLLPRPALSLAWATIAPGDERVVVDTTSARVRGTKEFDWLLTPTRAGSLGIPAFRYPFFDPTRRAYDVATTDSIAFDVASASLASADTGSVTRLPIRRVLRAERPPPLPTQPWYWAMLVLAPVPATLRRIFVRRRRRAVARTASRRLRLLARSRRPPPPRELRRTFLDAVHERVPLTQPDASPRLALARLLRRAGVTDTTAQAADELLDRLDRAAFSPSGVVEPSLVIRAVEVMAHIDTEAVRADATRSTAPATVAMALLAGSLLAAAATAMPEAVVRTFEGGVRAYERGDFATSQRLFSRTAARAPRAADGWANLGAAAWARGDTAHAVLAWQRALRLEPLDDETRERLAAVQPPLIGTPAYVPPLPADALALAALVLWTAAWIALVVQAIRRTPLLRPLAGATIACALVALAGALELHDRAAVRGLGVLRNARDLLDAPSSNGQPVAAANVGEVGALGIREGPWVRLDLGGARAGWLPAAAVLPLDGAGMD